MNKKGQFFLLAAVIISVVVAGLAVTKNYVVTSEEPVRFYDLSQEIKSETSNVIDYGVYHDFSSPNNNILIESFLTDVEENLYDSYPEDEFIFVFGNSEGSKVVNLAKDDLTILKNGQITGDLTVPGADRTSKSSVAIENIGFEISQPLRTFSSTDYQQSIVNREKIIIKFNNQDYEFNLKENQGFYLIIKRTSRGDVYIDTK